MKTLSELLKDGQTHSWQEIQQARTYEREQLRSWAHFPKSGEVYELQTDAVVSFLTHWHAPFTGGGTGTLKQGTRVRIGDDIDDEPIAVHAEPLEAARVERELVPVEERLAEKYAGFSLSLRTEDLNKVFRRVTEAP